MERSIIKEIRHLESCIRRYMSQGNEPMKIFSYTQIQVLRYLFSHPDENICQKDLEIITGLKKASMTGCLNVLEEKGFIFRETAKDDRRRNYIRLTEMMKQKGSLFEKRGQILDEMVVQNINDEELAVFFNVIDLLIDNITKLEENAA